MKNILFLTEVNSTNNYAANLLREANTAEPTAIMTFNQVSGRGQRGNSWLCAPNKDMACSFIAFPNIPSKSAPIWSMWFSNWVISFFKDLGIENAKIKWPNDIVVDFKKLSGILIENQIQGKNISSSILGIGINVNSNTEVPEGATSLIQLLGKEFNLVELGTKMTASLLDSLPFFSVEREDQIRKLYYKNLLGFNGVLRYKHHIMGEIEGKIKGVNASGMLILECITPIQKEILCDIKEVQLLTNRE
ncbi:biotin--[acetyl-CoA-carboxylase] ligase [Luteibaculum oceani]|uniref:Biotin--[acetyl-CoA-carboxylase] ligase n=1 Tax=Luteibaculum oceani TaxID=1294296 RepID=A0A5C6V9D0_9FLAO|nr:biotin--[acetyl-CoA-carboxylase] ligase [Luteibaculum oceani]TXC81747.1 biotin--[acetyl-CoA-carboxylase] ligase [Luteibaculum oceani]